MAQLIISMFLLLSALGFTFDLPLFAYAQARADDMAEQNYLRHNLGAYPVPACAIGEVLAKGSEGVTAEAVVGAWQQSPSHAYVLNDLRADRVGVGVAQADDGSVVWVVAVARTCSERSGEERESAAQSSF